MNLLRTGAHANALGHVTSPTGWAYSAASRAPREANAPPRRLASGLLWARCSASAGRDALAKTSATRLAGKQVPPSAAVRKRQGRIVGRQLLRPHQRRKSIRRRPLSAGLPRCHAALAALPSHHCAPPRGAQADNFTVIGVKALPDLLKAGPVAGSAELLEPVDAHAVADCGTGCRSPRKRSISAALAVSIRNRSAQYST